MAGVPVSGTNILASMMVAGAVMITAVSRCVIETCGDQHISRHHRAGNVRHAAGHDGEQFRFGHARRNGRMVSGASVWPMKMLAATLIDSAPLVPINLLHHDGHALARQLHDAEVIQNREERRDEDDDGQHLKGEDDAELPGLDAELVAEDELAAGVRIIQHVR